MLMVNSWLVLEWQRHVRIDNSESEIGSKETDREIERWWGFQGRQSVFFLWALERDLCHLQTKPHFLWLSPLKYSICQCHGPSVLPRRAASRVCWLCHSPIYIRHWQHHHVPNVPLACSRSNLRSQSLFLFYFSLMHHQPICVLCITAAQEQSPGSTYDFLCAPNYLTESGVWGLSLYTQNLEGVFLL